MLENNYEMMMEIVRKEPKTIHQIALDKISELEEKLVESEKQVTHLESRRGEWRKEHKAQVKNAANMFNLSLIAEKKFKEALRVIKNAADFLGQDTVTEKMAHECHYVLMNFLAKHEIKGSENEKRD